MSETEMPSSERAPIGDFPLAKHFARRESDAQTTCNPWLLLSQFGRFFCHPPKNALFNIGYERLR